ncbi:ffe9205b-3c88-4a9e-9c6a-38e23bec4b09 [Sclerotinia trifoliorum]|uniref:Ffe9205b-3c88-4a9e-9c6a-38e23bec4b09 n=1 Tax=Sclerotinia trifoliorum TaxID=28548 RepID=A0A8H2ZQJ6_9HELO|nr:ffe9205b-3c88-4a9e-9c6a-38e23bec4b09 [Sclerotinia trifoliorum]
MITTRILPQTPLGNSYSLVSTRTAMATTTVPEESFEVRQISSTEDWHPDPSKSLPLSPARQALVDGIFALYSCLPTIERIKRYTPDCVYDDQFVYANDRSKNEGYQIVRSDDEIIQFKNEQSWTFKIIPKTATINALVTLSLDPKTVHSDFI